MTTFDDRDNAAAYCLRENLWLPASTPAADRFVIVDGPGDEEWTVMTQAEAEDGEFFYEYS